MDNYFDGAVRRQINLKTLRGCQIEGICGSWELLQGRREARCLRDGVGRSG